MQNKDDENRPCFAYISKLSNWGKCRRHNLLLSNKFKTAKRGFLNPKIRKNRLINLLDSFLCSPLLFIVFLHISFVAEPTPSSNPICSAKWQGFPFRFCLLFFPYNGCCTVCIVMPIVSLISRTVRIKRRFGLAVIIPRCTR